MNCLGNIVLDKGHSLDPTPPAITTGSIIEFTKINSSLILTKKVIINNNYLCLSFVVIVLKKRINWKDYWISSDFSYFLFSI